MIPWQIYADYLEDRGYDTRLFRIAEEQTELDDMWDSQFGTYGLGSIGAADPYGDGYGSGKGNLLSGEGFGHGEYNNTNGDGFGNGDTFIYSQFG